MKANYGYTDGSGEYYITIDTDLCDGCGACVSACPKNVFDVLPDDYDDLKALVREELVNLIGVVCPGHSSCKTESCQNVCAKKAINHSW